MTALDTSVRGNRSLRNHYKAIMSLDWSLGAVPRASVVLMPPSSFASNSEVQGSYAGSTGWAIRALESDGRCLQHGLSWAFWLVELPYSFMIGPTVVQGVWLKKGDRLFQLLDGINSHFVRCPPPPPETDKINSWWSQQNHARFLRPRYPLYPRPVGSGM